MVQGFMHGGAKRELILRLRSLTMHLRHVITMNNSSVLDKRSTRSADKTEQHAGFRTRKRVVCWGLRLAAHSSKNEDFAKGLRPQMKTKITPPEICILLQVPIGKPPCIF